MTSRSASALMRWSQSGAGSAVKAPARKTVIVSMLVEPSPQAVKGKPKWGDGLFAMAIAAATAAGRDAPVTHP
jgi:hypothetical protein